MRLKRTLALTLVLLAVAGLVAPIAAADGLEYGDERAELTVHEPPWVDSDQVAVDRTDNRTIYEARGGELQVQLENADHEDVVNVGVADGSASVEHEPDRDVYHVEPDGDGTIAIYWDVEEPIVVDGNETGEYETTRYAASLQVSDSDWTHLRDDEYADTRQDAQNWSEVVSEADRIGVTPDWMLSVGVSFAEFASSPGAEFVAGVQAAIMIMTLEPGGLFVLAVFLALIALTAAAGFRWKHRAKEQLGDHDRAQQELRDAWLARTRSIAQQWDWPDILPDRYAQWMHDHWGPNVWAGFKNYELVRSPLHTKGLLLQMMTQLGYRGVVHYDRAGNVVAARALTQDEFDDEYGGVDVDGSGDDGSPPDVIDVDGGEFEPDGGVLETEEIERLNFEDLRFDDETHREIIDAVPAADLDESVFLPSVDIDLSRVSLPIDNHDVDDADLVRITDPEIPGDFEDYEQFARVHAKILETVVNHPSYTDEDGHVREEMDLLSFLSELDSVLADKAEFPVADTQRKVLYMIADHLDADDRADHDLEDAYEGGVGRADRDADVIGPEDIDLGRSRYGGDAA